MEKQERLEKQIKFILELDKIKSIIRQTYLANAIRKENDAEHSWHLAIMAIILEEYFDKDINLLKVIKMVLMHDVVEIDAGDTFCYDTKANQDKMIEKKKLLNVFTIYYQKTRLKNINHYGMNLRKDKQKKLFLQMF